jgi:Peptidase S46.
MVLNIQRREMEKDNAVRIKYASKNASVANAWKKWQGGNEWNQKVEYCRK